MKMKRNKTFLYNLIIAFAIKNIKNTFDEKNKIK